MIKLLAKLFIKDYENYNDNNVRTSYGKLSGFVGIISNVLLCVIKIITGVLSGSIAIIGDGINNLADAGSSIVTLIGFRLANEPADAEHPFGHQRIEYVTGLIVSFIVIAIGIILGKSSIESIISGSSDLEFSIITIVILAVSIFIKCMQSLFYYRVSKLIDSTALKASAVDSLYDCISTAVVLISCVISKIWSLNLDGYMGCIVSVIIIISGIDLVKESISPLIGEAPSEAFIDHISEKIKSYDGVLGIHDMVIHTYGATKIFVSVHVEVDSSININVSHDIVDNIEMDFLKDEHINLVIHMDPIDTKCETTMALKSKVQEILHDIDPVIMFHDFRIVIGTTHTNVLFDVVVPIRYEYTDEEIKTLISTKVKEYDNSLNVVITVDHNLSKAQKVN